LCPLRHDSREVNHYLRCKKNLCRHFTILSELIGIHFYCQIVLLIIMKVYCPSHKRANAKLFEISFGINILINHEEDLEPYSIHKDKHNLIYKPELNGLLDARNWILNESNDWILMIDDDVNEIKNEEGDISWDDFLSETDNIVKNIDDEIGLISYNNHSGILTNKDRKFEHYQAVLLNVKLLKSKNFKYEGSPFDRQNGQKAHCEDTNLIFFCIANDIKTHKIENIHIIFDEYHRNKNYKTTIWENRKNREKIIILTLLWLAVKYKNNKEITNYISFVLKTSLRNLRHYSREEFINEVSYETSNYIKGEEDMKNFTRMMMTGLFVLSMVVLPMTATSCSDGGGDGGGGGTPKTVEMQFRGYWSQINNTTYFEITSNEIITLNNFNTSTKTYASTGLSYSAYSENGVLYADGNNGTIVGNTIVWVQNGSFGKQGESIFTKVP